MRSLLTTGLLAIATVLGALAAGPAASAASIGNAATPATTPAESFTQLSDVSCFHKADCLAVGQHASVGKAVPVAYKWAGSKWNATGVPLPSGATEGILSSVSCATGGCVAVGLYANHSSAFGLAEYYNGDRWTAGTQPARVPGAMQVTLESVACLSSTDCVADGYYILSSHTSGPFAMAEVWNGSTWRLSKAPSKPNGNLDTISCPASNDCVLGGRYTTSSGSYAWAEKFDGAHWTSLTVPQPTTSKAPHEYFNNFTGVSCSSTTNCVGVGSSLTGPGHIGGFAEVMSNGAWHASTMAWPSGLDANGVSCPAVNYCVTVGGIGPFFPLSTGKAAFAMYNGSTWKLHTEPKPPSGQGNVLFGVDCVSSAYCVLTGLQGMSTMNTVNGLAGVVSGTKWTWQTTP